MAAPRSDTRGHRWAAAALAVVAGGTALTGWSAAPAAAAPTCRAFGAGALSVQQLPIGTDVTACGLVGRVVRRDGVGVTIPAPGTAVGIEALRETGPSVSFQVEVDATGRITYPTSTLHAAAAARRDPSACSDGAYSTNDLKVYGSGYKWWIGDGGMPGALSRAAAKNAFADAISNITLTYNDCGYRDVVGREAPYQGETSYEADINSDGNCTSRDHKSTWDAGNLNTGTVAATCWWSVPMLGIKNELLEADVRYNTTDYDFTDNVTSSCSNKYDVRSVGTHEAGHVFGMGHVGSGHSELTMYTNSFLCSRKAYTLGKGDVLGLDDIY